MHAKGTVSLILACALLLGGVPFARHARSAEPEEESVGQTPPRLGFVDGQVSFWRPGAPDWVQAQINTPLAPGDQLYTGSPGNLELQIGARAFVRGWANTQVGLENHEPDFLQFKVTTGYASFDLRTLDAGRTLEVDTPNAAFTIENPGYYRVDVTGDRTTFIARRGGRATVIPANGQAVAISPSEEVVIEGTENPQVAAYAAPQLDVWDKWNYTRTDELLDSVSARYVPAGTYGVDDLDHYGTWRVVPDYGSVWVPTAVPSGWVPYSTGSWVLDPFYGWTWVDTAPWGWAPFHYGRWVFVSGFWGWAPGPVVVRPVYAPALVAFFGGPSVSVGIAGPVVGWVALGWGEPCVPWWGRPGFVHRPWWGGWGGPRVVNNVVIQKTTVVNVQEINVYRNVSVHNAVVAVHEQGFGHGPIRSARVTQVDVRQFRPIHTAPQVTTTSASFVPTATRGIRPSEESMKRPVVATRQPHRGGEAGPGGERHAGPAGIATPAPRIVSVPRGEPASVLPRAPFGQSQTERSVGEPTRPPSPQNQKMERPQRPERGPEKAPPVTRQAPQPASPQKPETPRRPERALEAPPPVTRQTQPQPPSPAPVAPQPPAPQKQSEGTPPAVRQAPPQKPQTSQRPERGPEKAPPATRQTQPQPPSPAPVAPQPPAPQKQEGVRQPEKGLGSKPPPVRQAPPQPQPEARPGGPVAGPPQAPPRREAAPPVARPEAPRPPAPSLPGEPANRLAPNRGEMRPPQAGPRQPGRPEGRPPEAPGKGPQERPGG